MVFYTFCIFSPRSWKLADSGEARLNHKTFTDQLDCTALRAEGTQVCVDMQVAERKLLT